jgi:inner membrane protein
VGLMLARAGLDRTTPRGAGMMMLAANAPDIDVISWLGGTVTYLEYHRGYAHALASAPILALIPMLLVRAKLHWQPYIASLIGVLSHLALDCTNVYGVRMLLPFSGRWIRLDITDIVDPWIWAVLFLAIAAPAFARLVSSEIGETPSARTLSGPGRSWARFALVALFAYEIARYAGHERALAVMNARLFSGAAARRITVLPNRWNPLLWRGVVEQSAGTVTIVPVDLAGDFDPTAGHTDYPPPPSPAIEVARREKVFQVLGWFDQLPFWKITPGVDGTVVELIDLRFGTLQRPGLEARAIVDASGAAHGVELGFGVPR